MGDDTIIYAELRPAEQMRAEQAELKALRSSLPEFTDGYIRIGAESFTPHGLANAYRESQKRIAELEGTEHPNIRRVQKRQLETLRAELKSSENALFVASIEHEQLKSDLDVACYNAEYFKKKVEEGSAKTGLADVEEYRPGRIVPCDNGD